MISRMTYFKLYDKRFGNNDNNVYKKTELLHYYGIDYRITMWSVSLFCTLIVFGVALQANLLEAAKLNPSRNHEDKLPTGSPTWCMDKLSSFNLTNFEVLPGDGWDNLENKERGRVIQHTYYQCRTTADGKYLLPDGVITTPVKSSKLDVFSEVYKSWMDYKETTSKSINVVAKYSHGFFSIDGSFSAESQSVKENQIGKNSFITRTQARYVRYTVHMQPDASLHPAFRSRVMDIAKLIQTNEKDVARYESQLLIRDFGTHVLTGMDAGAVIAQIQHVDSSFLANSDERDVSLSASLSTSFSLGLFGEGGASMTGGSSSQTDAKQTFADKVKHSTLKTYGGPSYQLQNFQLSDWEKDMDDNMVAIDKEGTPLYYFITTSAFPELPSDIIPDLFNQIQHAVELYYKYNMYRGCTDTEKPNFNRNANVDDGTCTPPSTNFTFGGVYQNCTQNGKLKSNECPPYIVKNPLTGDTSCPSGYTSVILDSSNIDKTKTDKECHWVWYILFWSHKCTTTPTPGSVTVTSYWCAATGSVKQFSGYMFGGLYTPHVNNPMTGGSTCPPKYTKLSLRDGLTVCVTQDFDSGSLTSAPFGGFYTCHSGNPLAVETHQTHWPKSCPTGFSSHLAMISNECEIEYCAQIKNISDKGLPSLRKPPFIAYPRYRHVEATEIFIDSTSNTWTSLPTDMLEIQDATMDLGTANLVFRNNPEFDEQMQMINAPTMQMTYGNASSERNSSSIFIPSVRVKEKEIRVTDVDHTLTSVDNEHVLYKSPASSKSPDHQTLPNGIVAALSVVSTLLLVCVIAMVTMYRRRRVHKIGENQTLLG
ncbi:macrophage-expressed gene 1 protein-like [Argopecten irradians]|uniref:macrophage-expressed gene 1 protein-like n=1 Tax=Argopecten irradians TaxID=31199 RepID=UPI0037142296